MAIYATKLLKKTIIQYIQYFKKQTKTKQTHTWTFNKTCICEQLEYCVSDWLEIVWNRIFKILHFGW